MRSDEALELWNSLKLLSMEDKESILEALENYFGKQLELSFRNLSRMDREEFQIIQSVVNGLILTQKYIPDIQLAYEEVKNKKLPSTISFGCISQEKKEKN
ncbi:hypothetical protein [Paenibacillus sp. J2TS4]|uniref:hypothetical protein n=1 Tax=Paenibacillus sp. J2TS4 TaxID=2807194 RepID=UPI001B1EE4BC|nr:hypothetical protein [Paenibacillus sp. J2TS4]GIP32766.1 hypothetical protein J2TS4_19760 [Paenibacillus sp. J2TS4]